MACCHSLVSSISSGTKGSNLTGLRSIAWKRKTSGWRYHLLTLPQGWCLTYTWMKARICHRVTLGWRPAATSSSYSLSSTVSQRWLSSSSSPNPSSISLKYGAEKLPRLDQSSYRPTLKRSWIKSLTWSTEYSRARKSTVVVSLRDIWQTSSFKQRAKIHNTETLWF